MTNTLDTSAHLDPIDTNDAIDQIATVDTTSPVAHDGARVTTRDLTIMGGRGHLVVYGEQGERLLDQGEARLRDLESKWSRFLPDSDITRANHAAGTPVEVSADTIAVVQRALDGWRQTNGRFDITMLPALVEIGYTHSALSAMAAPIVPGRVVGLSGMVMVDPARSTITAPATSAIDLGGIGKGFAADLVADELIAAGASGVLVNLGGDLTVRGLPGDDTSWYLGIEDPSAPPKHVALLRVVTGGIATSGTTVRRWTSLDGSQRHHLIDPTTAQPATTATLTATVLAADCATAEVYATAAMMLDARSAVAMLDQLGLAGLVVGSDGGVHRSNTLAAFIA
ncbi:MAG: FAD:protein FMN transferase [Actinobacteria bacterium]|nr:FAD:protein FMN transferase [Actinomycetota bacterium]